MMPCSTPGEGSAQARQAHYLLDRRSKKGLPSHCSILWLTRSFYDDVFAETLKTDAQKTTTEGGMMRQYTEAELAEFDGKEGKPIYIAHQGRIYDVSESKLWRGGRHMKRHGAGADLTTDIQAAPHDADVLTRYPQVGTLVKAAAPTRPMPAIVAWLLETNPFFRRHPHPMTVHFPIVFLLSNPFFNYLYWTTGNRSFETTAYHCLGGGILFMLVAMVTGLFTWWYNYMGRMMTPIAIKIPLSTVTLIIAVASFVWRWNVPGVMVNLHGINNLYFLFSLSFVPLIAIIGWYGATMTFPIED
jgi:predicted heme/steroid binding protein/uncharacterized membrane protein